MTKQYDRREFLEYAGAALGLGAVLSGCASLRSTFSTDGEQRAGEIAHQGKKAVQAEHQPQSYAVTKEGILLTTIAHLYEAASFYGIGLEEKFYSNLLPGNSVRIEYVEKKVVIPEQLVAADGTIDTLEGRIKVAGRPMEDVDKEIEQKAGESVIVTQHSPSPYSTGTDIVTIGWVRYFDPLAMPSTGVARLPVNLHNFVTASGIGVKAQYLAVAIPRGNQEREVYGILAIAPMVKIAMGDSRYNLPLKSDFNVVVGSRDTLIENLRQAVGWTAGLTRDVASISTSVNTFLKDLDSIDELTSPKPGKTPVQKIGDGLTDLQQATGAALGVRTNIDALIH